MDWKAYRSRYLLTVTADLLYSTISPWFGIRRFPTLRRLGGELSQQLDGGLGGFELGFFQGRPPEAVFCCEIGAMIDEVLNDLIGPEARRRVQRRAPARALVYARAELDHQFHGFELAAACRQEQAAGAFRSLRLGVRPEPDQRAHHG